MWRLIILFLVCVPFLMAPQSHDLVDTDSLQTLTNKTLVAPVLTGTVAISGSWTPGNCVRVNALGTAFEDAGSACGGSAGNHTLLSSTHTDTTTASVVRGDIVTGQAGPAWKRFAIGTANRYLKSDGTDVLYSTLAASGTGTCTNQFVRVLSADAAPTCATVSLTADVTGTLPVANGGTGLTWSDQLTSADVNATTTTIAQVTGLSVTLSASTTYQFRGVFHTTVTSGGQQWDLSGTATVTNLVAYLICTNVSGGAVTLSGRFTALGSALNETATGAHSGFCAINGAVTINGGGTFFPRFAQQANASGTAKVLRGSLWSVK